MKLIVLGWFKDELIPFLGKLIELLFRTTLFLLPLGIFLFLIQYRTKVSKTSNLSVYTTEESVWQHIYPGFILVSINPETTKKNFQKIKKNFQNTIEANKYIIEIFFMLIIIALFWIKGIK